MIARAGLNEAKRHRRAACALGTLIGQATQLTPGGIACDSGQHHHPGDGMKIHLHVGPHKTGTTAIQSAAWAARDRLLQDHGLLYPKACRYHYAQHRLAFAMKGMADPDVGDRPDFDVEIAALAEELRQVAPERVLLSSEEFFIAAPTRMARLAEGLADLGDLEMIVTIRHPLDVALSMHNQLVKMLSNPYARPFEQVLAKPLTIFKPLEMNGRLLQWEKFLGKDAVRLLHYETGDMVHQMAALLGVEGALDTKGAVSNRSLHPKATEMIRLAKSAEIDPAARERIARIAQDLYPPDGSAPWLPRKRVTEFMQVVRPQCARVFRRHLDMDNPYDMKSAMARIGPPENALSPEDLVSILAQRV